MKAPKLNIFEFMDYRDFVRSFYKEQKEKNRNYSYQVFANMANLKSRTYIKLVIDGLRNLTFNMVPKFEKALHLNKIESKYFRTLISFNQSKDTYEKNRLLSELVSFKKRKFIKPLEKEKYEYYSNWYVPIIREIIALDDFKEDPKWIVEKLNNKITEKEALYAIDRLLKLNLITRVNGKLVQTDQNIGTHENYINLTLRKFNKTMVEKSLEYFETPVDERELSGLIIGLSKSDFEKVREDIREFRRALLQKYSRDRNLNDVYRFNVQFFCLTNNNKK